MITLDKLTLLAYPLFLLAAFGLLSCIVALVRRAKQSNLEKWKDRTPYVLISITTFIAMSFLFQQMFLRFRAVETKPDQIELVYVWPRPRTVISAQSFQSAQVFRDRKRNGHLDLVTTQGTFGSVGFSRSVNAEELRISLEKWAASHRQR